MPMLVPTGRFASFNPFGGSSNVSEFMTIAEKDRYYEYNFNQTLFS